MFAAKQAKEIVVEVYNEIGVLHQISKIVAEKGVNIMAVNADVVGENAVIRLLTDDNLRAVEALEKRNYKPTQADAVTAELPHKPGVLETVTDRLARVSIDIRHLTTTALLDQDKCLVVLATSDDQKAVRVLNEME